MATRGSKPRAGGNGVHVNGATSARGTATRSVIDLRSDTVTRPTTAMREAMARAEVGDDVLGDDPTVIALQERVAAILGKEAACFMPSGTMANQTAIRAHTEPGDEVIAHGDSHIIHYETGAPAALSGVMVRPLAGRFGQFDEDAVEQAVRPDSHHFARSRLLVIENTHNRGGGSVWELDKFAGVCACARKKGLLVHLDGARLWNACAATGHAPSDYAKHVESVSVCFSKGLGAPVGSAVCGSQAFVRRAHRFRKMFGGNMRQAGIVAAGALYALEHHVERLREDHDKARRLSVISEIRGLSLAFPVVTNMVFVDIDPSLGSAAMFAERLKTLGVWVVATGPSRVRLVTHLDVSDQQVGRAIEAFAEAAEARVPGVRAVRPAGWGAERA